MFKRERGNWALYRQRFGLSNADEIDLHFGRRDPHEYRWYDEVMADIEELVRKALRTAQENGRSYVMFVHGWSNFSPGKDDRPVDGAGFHAVKRGNAVHREGGLYPA